MRLCSPESNLNMSWAVLNTKVGNLYFQNDKAQPDGVYFKLFMKYIFFVSYEELIQYCKFVFVDSVGIYHKENDSYSGGYGLIQQSKVDTFLRAGHYNLKDKFYFLNCGSAVNHFATQTIERKINNNIDSLSYLFNFLIPSIEFSSLLISSLIFYFGFVFLSTKFKLISKFVLKLLSLLFIIFLFFIHNLYNSNLNTSNVIVDTSNLITDVDDVIKTNRELCVFEKISADNDFYFNAPEYSFASKLNKKINHNDLCYVANLEESKLGNFLEKGQDKTFIFTFDIARFYLLKGIQTVFKKDLFISNKIYENLRTMVISKKASKQKRTLLENWLYRILENQVIYANRNFPSIYAEYGTVKFGEYIIYDSLQNYIKHFTITRPISFDKLESLFIIYFGFLILLTFIFFIHHLNHYPINWFKYLVRKLSYRLIF